MSKLDELLEDNGLKKYDGDKGYTFIYVEDTEVGDIKQEVKDLFLELIGDDETLTTSSEYDKPKWIEQENNISLGANQLRAVLRKKVDEL